VSEKVKLDKSYKPVADDSPDAAFSVSPDDPRFAKYLKKADKAAAKPEPAKAEAAKPEPAAERVERPAQKGK
jgi:hypothetical protein